MPTPETSQGKSGWTRQQLLVAFHLYCQMPFGKMHSRNPEIIKYSNVIGRTPSALSMKLTNIASLDPAITSTGRKGLVGASSADRAMWNEMQEDWEHFAEESKQVIDNYGITEDDREGDPEEIDYTGGDKLVQTKIRVGQDFFRKAVLSAYNYQCCITGLSVPKLLVASHIVPWRIDAGNRLNPRNGLCLSLIHDKVFDSGMMTVSKDMTVVVSGRIKKLNDMFLDSVLLRYHGKPVAVPEKFAPMQEFLDYHRGTIFNK